VPNVLLDLESQARDPVHYAAGSTKPEGEVRTAAKTEQKSMENNVESNQAAQQLRARETLGDMGGTKKTKPKHHESMKSFFFFFEY
jgi:hypothetical protein